MLATYPVMTSDRFKGMEKRLTSAKKNVIALIKADLDEESKAFKKAFKKLRKAQYMEENYRTFLVDVQGEHLTNYFRRNLCENGDSWNDVFIFNTTDRGIVTEELEKMYVEINGSSWTSAYDCTGRVFTTQCEFYELDGRTIVVQYGAYDV